MTFGQGIGALAVDSAASTGNEVMRVVPVKLSTGDLHNRVACVHPTSLDGF